jgi:hypothetical protein
MLVQVLVLVLVLMLVLVLLVLVLVLVLLLVMLMLLLLPVLLLVLMSLLLLLCWCCWCCAAVAAGDAGAAGAAAATAGAADLCGARDRVRVTAQRLVLLHGALSRLAQVAFLVLLIASSHAAARTVLAMHYHAGVLPDGPCLLLRVAGWVGVMPGPT